MRIYTKASLFIGALLIFNGCNVYRQKLVMEVPYNGNDSTLVSDENENSNLGDVVNETINESSEQTFTNENETNISTKNSTVVQRVAFPVSEYNSLATTGSAAVTGSIYIKSASGSRVIGKNTRLYLNPVTSYSTQWYLKSYLGGAKMSKVDSRLFNYLKFTTSNSSGKFEFLNIPSGSYYLIGVVKCGTACGYSSVKNIRIAKKISIFGSDTKMVDLTKSVK